MSLLQRAIYQLWYYRKPPWDTGISPPELMEHIARRPPGSALDLGCGTGTNAITLAQHGWRVTGVDFAWRAIRLAERKARLAGVSVDFRVGDVAHLSGVQEKFDLVLDIGCLHSLDSAGKTAYLNGLRRWLAPGGVYLLYAFTSANEGGRPALSTGDIQRISEAFSLVQRVDGSDRGSQPSAWFTFSA